jgi:hypothetical protein
MRFFLLAVCLTACGDDACDDDGAGRCTGAHSMMFCERGEWRPVSCETPTPNCVAQGFRAACIGERAGSCEFESFTDRCVDERTLEDCTLVADTDDAIKHHVRCPEGQRCGEAPRASFGPQRPPHARFACFAPRPRAPAIVTFARGDLRVAGQPAPPVPFEVDDTLELAAGAHAVLLVAERASQLDGPGTFDPDDYRPEGDSAEPIELEGQPAPIPDDPLIAPAPEGVQRITLIVGEGVPGASSRLGTIRWRCEGECGREVELTERGRVLWRGQGEGSVAYDGPALDAPASYTLRIGDAEYEVRTLPPIPMRELMRSMSGWPLVERMSVVAAIHRWRGSRAAAVATLELAMRDAGMNSAQHNAELRALLDAYRGPAAR